MNNIKKLSSERLKKKHTKFLSNWQYGIHKDKLITSINQRDFTAAIVCRDGGNLFAISVPFATENYSSDICFYDTFLCTSILRVL